MRISAFLALMVTSMAANAQPGGVTSAYTELDLDICSTTDSGEEPGWMEWECAGYAGIPLYVQSGDDRYDLDAGVRDEDGRWSETFDYPGDRVEWRLSGGRPFAIIYRLRNANPERPPSSKLVVETIGSAGTPGCRVAEIDGATSDANVLARRAADAVLDKPGSCLKAD